tara:strand:+ start:3296 stop:4129 length:834 start_codon:yes stop_codon:yes gene_type:complete
MLKNNNKGWLKSFLVFPLIFIPQIFASIILILLGFDLYSVTTSKIDLTTMVFLEYSMIFFMLIILYFCMKYIDKEKFTSIGLDFSGRLVEFIFGIFLGFIIMAFAFSTLILFGEIVFERVIIDYNKIIMSILLFIGVSFYEEVIFRGYMLKNLMQSFNPFVSLFISSILFCLIHSSNPNVNYLGLINIFLAGYFLGISYVSTKNLWFPFALHFSWNFFQSMFGFNVSGLDSYSIIDFSTPKNNFFNGGEFGFESSIISIVILISGSVIIWNYFKKNG